MSYFFEASNGRGWSSNYGGASFEGVEKTFVLGI
jgi:hypothetical protein